GQYRSDDEERSDEQNRSRNDLAEIERFLRIAAVFHLHQEGADDRRYDAETGEKKRKNNAAQRKVGKFGKSDENRTEYHRSDDRTDIRFEKIGPHARDVADIVADIVRDRR